MAPELFDPSASYGIEVDIWAFGSMIFEIASGLPPNVMAGIDISRLGSYLKTHTPRLEGGKYSEQLKDLVSFCLVEDPAKRPIIEEVQHHPYLLNTENTHPTSSLAMLVKAFRVWEAQGGNRKSLFAKGGAQGPSDSDLSSTALANDEWNFSTTVDFDQRVMSNTDAQAVYDVYGSQVELADLGDPTPQALKPKRRRPPPNLPVMRAPLEKVFDPNTISNYEENARAYYGMPPLPPVSDLPLRDNSHNATLRESLIDLDASLYGDRLSKFVEMAETIKVGPRKSRDYDFGDEYARGPNSDPETVMAASSRKTREWKFPVMMPQSANPEMSHFSFNDESNNQPGSARPHMSHHITEPFVFPQEYNTSSRNSNLMVPRAASQMDNRVSVGSLIDLDESLPEPPSMVMADIPRPSTANSDMASEVGGAFDLERHASYYALPSTNREPSIYISDDSDLAAGLAATGPPPPVPILNDSDKPQRGRTLSVANDGYVDDTHLYPAGELYMMGSDPGPAASSYRDGSANGAGGELEYNLTRSSGRTPSMSSVGSFINMPPLLGPPSERVMMGEGGQVMRDEFLRLLEGMTRHLKFTGEYVGELPVSRAGRGQELQSGQLQGFQ